ncbi:MAG: PUA domain-containing protein [Promethearchaeota archaeon]
MVDMQFGTMFADYIYSQKERLFIEKSKNTGKLRYVYLDHDLILTLRPNPGFFTISIRAGSILNKLEKTKLINGIMVLSEVAEYIQKGRNVFAKHVINPSLNILPFQELYICDENRKLLAVGKAVLSGRDMLFLNRGIAVKVRHGIESKSKKVHL